MKKIILIVVFSLFIIFDSKTIYSSTNNINIIFSDYQVEQGEEFEILINFNNIEKIQSMQLVIEVNQYFELTNDVPCSLNLNSYFTDDEIYVNEYLDNVIKFVCFKKTTNNNFNNLCVIKLTAKSNISNVSEHFKTMKLSLFNDQYELIPLSVRISEGIKIEWLNSDYIIDLYGEIPDFLNDIKVLNRDPNEYFINLITEKINTSVVCNTVVSIYVVDYTNNQTIYISKSVRIVDQVEPTLCGNSVINIKDKDLTSDNFIQFSVSDNYDQNPLIYTKYYDQEKKEIQDQNKFYEYLKSNQIGYLETYAVDSSKNQSNVLTQMIKISDTTAPLIECGDIEVKDVDLSNFNLLDYIKITDAYDPNPKFYYMINNTDELDIISHLSNDYQVNLSLYSIDLSNNSSIEYNIKITLVDTINPTIEKIQDLEIIDSNFTTLELELLNAFKAYDNFNLDLTYQYTYILEEVVSKEDFMKGIYSQAIGTVQVYVVDSYQNSSNIIEVKIKLVDTTPPVIIIENIEEGKKYLSIPSIIYKVTDNFNNELTTVVLLDGEEYKNSTINMIGHHTIEIIVTDGANNTTNKIVNFDIIKNNLIGCGTDPTCYKDNYLDIIYLALLFFSVSVFIVIVRIAIKRNKRREKEL